MEEDRLCLSDLLATLSLSAPEYTPTPNPSASASASASATSSSLSVSARAFEPAEEDPELAEYRAIHLASHRAPSPLVAPYPQPTSAPPHLPLPAPAAPPPHLVVLVLCGIPGSGKSTFALELEQLRARQWRRINQDDLGTRVACEEAARRALSEGVSVIIDRCNFDEAQRKTWIMLARSFRVECQALVFQVAPRVCINRARARKCHPTINESNAEEVIRKMAISLTTPKVFEGFSSVRVFSDTVRTQLLWG
jgi:predicted kinase